MRHNPRRRPVLLAPLGAVVGGLLLSGCGALSPGTAAEVGGTRITTAKVQDVAAAQCELRTALKGQQGVGVTSRSKMTLNSLGLLMDTALSQEFLRDKGVSGDPKVASTFLGQITPIFEPLPSGPRQELTSVFTTWSKARAGLVAVGAAKTGEKPSPENLQGLLQAGLQQRQSWLTSTKPRIDTDPRYAPGKDGFPGSGDGSVSQARSSYAVAAGKTDLDPTFAAGLPASQQCG